MQWNTSLNPCDGLSHRGHTCTRIWQYEGPASIENNDVAFVNHSLTLQSEACGPRPLGMSLGSRCHTHRVVRRELLPCNSPRLSIFSPQGPTYRCPFTEPFDGFRSTFGQSSGFTTDSPALESTVISRYRTRLPSVATGLLSIDMLSTVTAFRSTSSGHHSPTLELSLGRSSHSLEMSYCDAFICRHWYTPSLWHTEQAGKFAEKQPFTSGTDFATKRRTVFASHPNNHGMDPLRLGDLHCKVSKTSRKASLSS